MDEAGIPESLDSGSVNKAIKWFKEADKSILMDEGEIQIYHSIPDTITLYRGVSVGRKLYGLSWTNDKDVALWFKDRFDRTKTKGSLLMVEAKKENILASFGSRNEHEYVLDVNAAKDKIVELSV